MTAIAQACSAALFEFVWQGLLAAFLLWMALFILQNRSARARYLAGCVALAVMTLLPIITACVLYRSPANAPASAAGPGAHSGAMRAAMRDPAVASFAQAADWARRLANWALPAWSLGVLLLSLRLVWASRQISTLRRQAQPAETAVLAMIGNLSERMKLARPVRVLISMTADCPSVVGWIKPILLLPTATVLGLTPQQLEAVLAHELAHIRRYDYLVNMLQTIAETLLFYHPAIWWASSRIRIERELCCDDAAVASCGDALCYARALTRLERLRVTTPNLALSSAGGPLLYRIQRLAGKAASQRGPSKSSGILALSLGLVLFAFNIQWARGQQQPPAQRPDEPAVKVELGASAVIRRDDVDYPDAAIEKRVQGTVVVEATVDAAGMVSDARVLSGPPELRKTALQSVLEWQFANDAAGSTRQVTMVFELPSEPNPGSSSASSRRAKKALAEVRAQQQLAEKMAVEAQALQSRRLAEQEAEAKKLAESAVTANLERELASAKRAAALAQLESTSQQLNPHAVELERQLQILQQQAASLGRTASLMPDSQVAQMAEIEKRLAELQAQLGGAHPSAILAGRRLKIVDVRGLADVTLESLVARLPVHLGDTLAEDSMEKVEAAVKGFDEHLGLRMFVTDDGQVEILITAPGSGDVLEPHP
jgi:TonB family protein